MKALPSVLFALLLATLASAQELPQLTLTGSLSNPAPHHGEAVRLDMKIRNDGPSRVTSLWIDVDLENALVLQSDNELCHRSYRTAAFRCATGAIPAGTEVDFSVEVRVGNSGSSASIEGEIETFIYTSASGSTAARPDEWSFDLEVPLSPLGLRSDLAVTLNHAPIDLPLDQPVTFRTTVSSFGPDDVSNLQLFVESVVGTALGDDPPGGRCTVNEYGGGYECSIPFLAAGAQIVVQDSVPASPIPATWIRKAVLTFPGRTDPDGSNNSVEKVLRVGSGEIATVLIPLATDPLDGAHGSRWISEFSVYIDADEETFFYPLRQICGITCPDPAYLSPNKPLDLASDLWVLQSHPGYLLHFDRRKAGDISFAHRIRDVSREQENWGTEIPIVRSSDFLRGRTHLIDIPSRERFRQTLRLYGPDGGSSALIVRVYGDNLGARSSEKLIDEKTIPLIAPPSEHVIGEHASYAQVDLHSVFPESANYDRLRVEIEPSSGDPEYWAFVSITNNETQHVTLVTPQLGGGSGLE